MVFKTTSTKHSRALAFTLVEMLISVGIAGLLMIVCLSLTLHTTRSIATLTDSVDLGARSRYAIDRMSQKLRQASAVQSFSTNSITVNFKGKTLTYTYNPTKKELTEIEQGSVKPLPILDDCDKFAFTLYKRTPITNSFDQFPAGNTLKEAKVIHVTWHCGRTLVSRKSGSTEMASERIVLRSK